MDKAQQRRRARKKRKQQRAAGCIFLASVMVALAVGLVIFLALRDPWTDIQWTSQLEQNPYGPEDFSRVNGYLTCTGGPARMGIDVSEYQGTIDWNQVRSAGFDFAFIRIGYRGYRTGEINPDDRGRENLEAARSAGLDIGVYFYAQAVSIEEAAEEARWCLEFLDGYELELPVVYDWEYVSADARTGQMDRATLTECVQVFCDAVAREGYQGMVYFNPSVADTLLDLEALQEYPWWLAMYKDEMDYPYRVDIWQYTETGSVPGIEGDIDIDLMFFYK